MTSERDLAARALAELDALLDLDAAVRRERLGRLAAESPDLAARVSRMLAADEAASGPLEAAEPAVASAVAAGLAAPGARAPERVGAWRLVELLGTGGMGEVWLGERTEGGFAQTAAIKLVRAEMSSAAVLARFEVERQVLARLSHPGIARVLDGGVSEDGRPWFAMERVEGEPITAHATSHGLDLEARLRLLAAVCDAVDAAHRNLVVHRDLKPSNVLVTPAGEVKLLDFGIAKLLDPELDPGLTRTEARALTPAYAAPEQILGEPVTTATDVYSLGVLAYELLTGQLPHRRRSTTPAGLADQVRRETVERPSEVARRAEATSSGATSAGYARRLEGDLDAVVLMALRREPERRYPSAAALAADLRAHLARRPVTARPDSAGYRARKFALRHRTAVAAAAAAVAALTLGLGAALIQAERASRAAERATREAERAESEAARALAAGERAGRMKDFLLSIFREASPMQRDREEPLSIAALLDRAEARIDAELADDPLLQADLWDDLAETRAAVGDFAAADRLIERALAAKLAHLRPGDPSIAESLANRSSFAAIRGDGAAALADADRALAILEAAGAGDSRQGAELATIRTNSLLQVGRAEEALAEARRAHGLHVRHTGADHAETILQLSNVASIALRLGLHLEARETFREVVAAASRSAGASHALLYYPLRGLGRAEEALGNAAAAEAAFRRALDLTLERLGPDHLNSALAHYDVGRLELARGETAGRDRLRRSRALLLVAAPARRELAEIDRLLAGD